MVRPITSCLLAVVVALATTLPTPGYREEANLLTSIGLGHLTSRFEAAEVEIKHMAVWRGEEWWRCLRRGEMRRLVGRRRMRGRRGRRGRMRGRWWLGHQWPGSDHGCRATGPQLVGPSWTCPSGVASCPGTFSEAFLHFLSFYSAISSHIPPPLTSSTLPSPYPGWRGLGSCHTRTRAHQWMREGAWPSPGLTRAPFSL